ncbi:hypothetical protein GCM10027347_44260 [Larkinella harenae]
MKKVAQNFLPLGKILGFGVIAQQAGASYQTVSKFCRSANNEKAATKRRICEAMIAQGELLLIEIQNEINELKQWQQDFLPKN